MCVCAVNTFSCVTCTVDGGKKNTYGTEQKKKKIRCYFIRWCTFSPWWEATFHNYAIFQFLSLSSLFNLKLPNSFPYPKRFFLLYKETQKVQNSGSRWECYSDFSQIIRANKQTNKQKGFFCFIFTKKRIKREPLYVLYLNCCVRRVPGFGCLFFFFLIHYFSLLVSETFFFFF